MVCSTLHPKTPLSCQIPKFVMDREEDVNEGDEGDVLDSYQQKIITKVNSPLVLCKDFNILS